MKVFISWSGELSQAIAMLLRKYLPTIIQNVEPFVSSHDIASGERWVSRLTTELGATNYGIICLSSSNLQSPWILFEAGALSKFDDGAVCSLLVGGLSPTDVNSPLSQFQNRRFEKNDFRHLVHDIDSRRETPLEAERFDLLFDTFWPKIEAEYNRLVAAVSAANSPSPAKRSDRDLLEEVVFRLRGLERLRIGPIDSAPEPSGQILDLPVTHDSLTAYTVWKFPGSDISEHWQNALLRDISSKNYPSIRHIDDAVNQAMPAVRAYQQEIPALFNSGTDFITKALGFVDSDFRQHHPFGQETRKAFGKYSGLIKA